jgi:hypothetical protein
MFKLGFADQAILIYQKLIESDPYKIYPTEGLGNSDMAKIYY